MKAITEAVLCFALFVPVFAQSTANRSPQGHRILAVENNRRVAIVDERGEIEWQVPIKSPEVHDIAMLPNGNVLFQTNYTTVVEMNREKEIVWQHESKPKEGYTGRVEIHSYQRLSNGLTMIAESGNARIIEVDKDGKIVHEIPLTVERPNAHRDTRMARKLEDGHYLVCHEGDSTVREYDASGKVVWSYVLDLNDRPATPGHAGHGTSVFGAIRLPNGNTMIAGGNNNRVMEVTREGRIVWSVEQAELPGISLAWVTTLHQLPNGNLVIGNTHAGPENPQLIEVTRDKKVVWTFKDFTNFGNNLVAAHILDTKVIR